VLLLYSRLKASALGEQRTREEIIETVRAAPGLTPRGIAQRVGKHENTIRYNLRVLEKAGHLAARLHGARMHYFAAGQGSPESATAAATLRTRAARLLYEAARSAPGIGVAEASAIVGVHRTTLHYHANKLERAGLLVLRKEPDGLRLYPSGA
jgi:predicted transcriptional regulator